MKLNQVIAVEQGTKAKGNAAKSDLYKVAQKPALFNGFIKKYYPKAEGGERFPDEKQKVQFTARDLVNAIGSTLQSLFNVEAAKDYANCVAKADVVVDGKALLSGVPATFLLYLSKELTDLDTFISALPILSEDDEWKLDPTAGLNKTDAIETIKTKKIQKPIVLYPATPEHPAQTQLITEDEVVGTWQQTKLSGAYTNEEKKTLLARVQKLANAVKVAREQANMVEADNQDAGNTITKWLFGGNN
jgi:hypothetical protein